MSINSFKLVVPSESARAEAHSVGAMLLPESCQEALVCAHRSRPETIMSPQMSLDAALARTMSPARSATKTPTGSVARTKRRSSWLSCAASSARLRAVRSREASGPADVPHSSAIRLADGRRAPTRRLGEDLRDTREIDLGVVDAVERDGEDSQGDGALMGRPGK